MVDQGDFHAEERGEATAGKSLSPTPSGVTSVGKRLPLIRASRAGMASPEEESTSTTGKLVTRTSLCCGCTVSTIIRAGRTSTTA